MGTQSPQIVLPQLFQRKQSAGIDARYHLSFTGEETLSATVVISNQRIEVSSGLHGKPDLALRADARTWLGFLAKEKSLLPALLTGKIRIKGSPSLLKAFGRCCPS
ncbi:SCP2 sterol-binding domain-containing protein [Sporomusa acidovorans]|uniref:SCP2 sterol-binding domain-containing protein n=1 Tax=Sporomusa acidovorans TaxID=112900 RepID=UPI000B8420B0